MNSQSTILENIKNHAFEQYAMPDINNMSAIKYENKVNQFIEISKSVGGDAVELKEGEDLNKLIASLYPDAKVIASSLSMIDIATIDPDIVEKPHDLNGTDLAIVKGKIGVAENGCVWIEQNVKEKVVYFISEYLVIILDKTKIMNNMHEAYKHIEFNEYGFGMFISGPSKTADIEQALVIGAHGAKGLTVVLV